MSGRKWLVGQEDARQIEGIMPRSPQAKLTVCKQQKPGQGKQLFALWLVLSAHRSLEDDAMGSPQMHFISVQSSNTGD